MRMATNNPSKRFSAMAARRIIMESLDNDTDDDFPEEESDSDHANEQDDDIESDRDPVTEPSEQSSEVESEESSEEDSAQAPKRRRSSATRPVADNPEVSDNPEVLVSKNNMRWNTSAPTGAIKTVNPNILRQRSGVTNAGRITYIIAAFNLFVTDDILNIVVRETNRYAINYCETANKRPDPPSQPMTWIHVDICEMKAVIGLLIQAGLDKSSHVHTDALWAPNARPFFKSVMSSRRFQNILRFLRFDDFRTREQRKQTDKLAPLRDIWMMFLSRLPMMYRPGMDMTVDEQLVSFRGRCAFKQYIPSKPGKYGLKIFWNCDATTSYPLKGEIYLGRQPGQQRDQNQGQELVKRLTQPWHRSGRNVTCDNFFTSTSLAEELLAVNTTVVGTMRSNKREIPAEMQKSRRREVKSSLFGFNDQLTLVSYVPKKNKAVILLSSMHHDDTISEENDRKPDIILHYNDTKSGVDNLNHLVRTYTCKRGTRRWPLCLFMNMLDVAAVAAYVIWMDQKPEWNRGKNTKRRTFLSELANSLVLPEQERRLQNPQAVQKGPKLALQLLGFEIPKAVRAAAATNTQGRCHACPRNLDKKVRSRCDVCQRACCREHSVITCDDCN